jgi:hypothetical protein
MAGIPPGYNQNQGGYPNQPNYPRGPYQGPPQQPPVGGNYPQGPYQGPPQQYPPAYGQPSPYGQQNPYGHANPNAGVTPGLVTAGFIMALIPCTAKIGLILCAIGMGEAKKRKAGEGLALAGIIIGACWLVGWVVFYIAISAVDAASSSSTYYY